jgi:hypothetical protein
MWEKNDGGTYKSDNTDPEASDTDGVILLFLLAPLPPPISRYLTAVYPIATPEMRPRAKEKGGSLINANTFAMWQIIYCRRKRRKMWK